MELGYYSIVTEFRMLVISIDYHWLTYTTSMVYFTNVLISELGFRIFEVSFHFPRVELEV